MAVGVRAGGRRGDVHSRGVVPCHRQLRTHGRDCLGPIDWLIFGRFIEFVWRIDCSDVSQLVGVRFIILLVATWLIDWVIGCATGLFELCMP